MLRKSVRMLPLTMLLSTEKKPEKKAGEGGAGAGDDDGGSEAYSDDGDCGSDSADDDMPLADKWRAKAEKQLSSSMSFSSSSLRIVRACVRAGEFIHMHARPHARARARTHAHDARTHVHTRACNCPLTDPHTCRQTDARTHACTHARAHIHSIHTYRQADRQTHARTHARPWHVETDSSQALVVLEQHCAKVAEKVLEKKNIKLHKAKPLRGTRSRW